MDFLHKVVDLVACSGNSIASIWGKKPISSLLQGNQFVVCISAAVASDASEK